VKDKVIVGNAGAELGVRGYVAALDVKNGKELWRAYNTGPDHDVKIGPSFKAFYQKDQGRDLGVTSWPPDQWKLGGSTVWGWMSYDPGDPWRSRRRRHGTELARRGLVVREQRRTGVRQHRARARARHADVGREIERRRNLEARRLYQDTGARATKSSRQAKRTSDVDLLHEIQMPANEAVRVRLRHQSGALQPFEHGQTHVFAQSGRMGRCRDMQLVPHPEIEQQLLKAIKSFRDVRAD